MGENSPENVKRGSYVGPHLLGDTLTDKLNDFEKKYVYYKQTYGGYPVEEKVILKKNIYKKIHDFNDFIVKSCSTGSMTPSEAAQRLAKILNIGIKLASFDTRQLEKDVKKLAEPEEFEKYLSRVRFR